MPHKDINNITTAGKMMLLAVAIISGIIHFGKRDLEGIKCRKKIILLFYDATVSGSISIFIGLIVFYYTNNLALTLGVGGIAGHLGIRVIYLVELFIAEKLKSPKLEEEIRKFNEDEQKFSK